MSIGTVCHIHMSPYHCISIFLYTNSFFPLCLTVSCFSNYSAPMGAVLSPSCWASYTILTLFFTDLCIWYCHDTIYTVDWCASNWKVNCLTGDTQVFLNNIWFILSSNSPVFLQLHCSHGNGVVPWLPRGLWEQPELRMADHLGAWLQNPPGLQWLWPGATLWLPHHQRWGPIRRHNIGSLLRGWGSLSPDVQQQHFAVRISGWSFYVRARVQHHL